MDKKSLLIEYLKKHTKHKYITAKKLSDFLGVSDRTVRNYVKELNEEQTNVILSSNQGYKINEEKPNDHQLYNVNLMSNPADNRYFYIIRRLIKSSERGLDLFDLSDTLYVSDSTIRKDISNINESIKEFHLRIAQEGNRFKLIGEEKHRRKLMISLIQGDSKGDHLSLEDEIQMFLEKVSLEELKELSKSTFEKHSIQTDSYFFRNFILHLAISVSRSVDKEHVKREVESTSKKKVTHHLVIEDIASKLSEQYDINLSQADQDELETLFMNQVNSSDKLRGDYVSEKVYQSLNYSIQEINNVYMIDFNDEKFKKYLSIHVQNLYNRFMDNKLARNLSTMHIKVRYPIIFDIAVYFASILSNELNIKINDDEISFLALHIGAYLTNNPEIDEEKIETVIITPSYLKQQKKIYNFIQNEFDDELVITNVLEYVDEIDKSKPPRLIITTENIKNDLYKHLSIEVEVVKVREFLTRHDLTIIRNSIDNINHANYEAFLKEKLPIIIKEEFYISSSEVNTKEKIMQTMAIIFEKEGYVKRNYLKQLKKREELSSTAYPSGVAIPHAMKYEGLDTGLIIIIPKNKINWDKEKIQLAIGLSVNEEDSRTFNLIFPRIVELVAEAYNVKYLIESKNREEFINRLMDLMLQENYYP